MAGGEQAPQRDTPCAANGDAGWDLADGRARGHRCIRGAALYNTNWMTTLGLDTDDSHDRSDSHQKENPHAVHITTRTGRTCGERHSITLSIPRLQLFLLLRLLSFAL